MKLTGLVRAGAICLLGARAAAAQTVRGTLVGQDGIARVAGGIVQLVDSTSRVVGQALSRSDGSFALAAPRPGGYRLRALRIGFTPTLSAPFTLAPDELRSVRLVLSGRAVVLAAVAVKAERRCRVDPDSGSEAARLWEEVRKALTATVLSEQSRSYRVRLAVYEQELDRDGRRITARTQREMEGTSVRPFASESIDTLARYGFVRGSIANGSTFYGADAALLVSDVFTASHCLRLEAPDAAPAGHGDWIGLAFEPVRHDRPDIAGTLWVDRSTAELRQLDYVYTAIPRAAREAHAGGHTDFLHLPDGAWLVRRWSIRMPMLTIRMRGGSFGYLAENQRSDTTVRAMRASGGELLELGAGPGDVWRGRSNVVRGTIVDGATGSPRTGVVVTLEGTQRSATTDSSGAFAFTSLFPGRYVLHAVRAGQGTPAATADVVVPDSGEVDLRVRSP